MQKNFSEKARSLEFELGRLKRLASQVTELEEIYQHSLTQAEGHKELAAKLHAERRGQAQEYASLLKNQEAEVQALREELSAANTARKTEEVTGALSSPRLQCTPSPSSERQPYRGP